MPMVYLDDRLLSFDQGWGRTIKLIEPILNRPDQTSGFAFAFAGLRSAAARMYARVGQEEEALRWLASVLDAIDEAPAWADNYPRTACDAAVALWWMDRTDHIELIERNIREKIIEPDFRYPMKDGRLAMAQLSALQGRYDAASEWFGKARSVLDEQGARPLRAIVDFDEALMFQRRGAAGDSERAARLLDTALLQFRELEMKGWIRRAEAMRDADRMPDISPARS
jgi:tetratricopeptide (TPR) repeat protein